MTTEQLKRVRLDLSLDEQEIVRKAAALSNHRSMSAFARAVVVRAAQEVLDQHAEAIRRQPPKQDKAA